MIRNQLILDVHDELIVDNFAGGGGASTGIEMALGRHVDIAVNHDEMSVALHSANHPQTHHFCEDVFTVDPRKVTNGRPIGLAWFSPDCKHFSKAKGGRPKSKKIRGLAWVVVKWAAIKRPRVIILENVEEFENWGPLLEDGTPCKKRAGRTFQKWLTMLRNMGYAAEYRRLRACDYGAPTIRKRLYIILRCDGQPIVWPEPTHGDPDKPEFRGSGLKRWRTAAECIDWSLPCPSIFLTKDEARAIGVKRPLAEATLRRLARGIRKFVIEAKEPFIIQYHSAKRGLAVPFMQQSGHYSSHSGMTKAAREPMRTQATGASHALVTAFLAKHFGGVTGTKMGKPLSTVTSKDHQSLVAAHLAKFRPDHPLHTISAGGNHIGEVHAFLMKYYGEGGQDQTVKDPLHTIPTKARFGLVVIWGTLYQISDIGMRMLVPRELYRGQGFPEGYNIQITLPVICRGKFVRKPLSQEAQIRMCGNSVSPPVAAALVAANVPELGVWRKGEKKRWLKTQTTK